MKLDLASSSQPTSKALRRIQDLPGPRGLPLLGNALQFTLSRLHQDLEALSLQYGSIVRTQLGQQIVLVVRDHELINAMLRDRPNGFRRPTRLQAIVEEMGMELGVFNAEGDVWQKQRRMVMASFSPSNVRAYFPALQKVTLRLQERWLKAARQNQSIDLQADLRRFTVDVIAGLAFGADINTLESDEDVIQRHLDKIFPALHKRMNMVIPYWRVFKLPSDRQLDRSVAAVNVAIQGFIIKARHRMQADPSLRERPSNLLEAMIVAADQADSGVGDKDVAGNTFTMLLAGEDTTANSLAWLIYLLHKNPQALQRVQEEVRALAPDASDFSPDQMAQLVYLEACAHESMRLKPVAPTNVLEALNDTTIGDVAVPAGTLVWCVMRGDSVDDRYFPNATAFDPERWLNDPEDSGGASVNKRVSMPFGSGPRVCPGRYLALLEIKMAMALLLSRFDIVSVDTEDGGEAKEHMAFAMSPQALSMRLRERAA